MSFSAATEAPGIGEDQVGRHPATRAALALQQAEGERPIDLLLTDVIMPGMNGREVAARIKAARPSLKVIFTSGYAEEAIAQDGILDPGITFLPKPFVLGDLAAKIREILEG